MFFDELNKAESIYKHLFNFKVIHDIARNKINLSESTITSNDDFLIIRIKAINDNLCPVEIYLGVNKSKNHYGIYLNEKAIIYNYEEFESFEEFEKELYYFLSSPVQAVLVTDKNDEKIYSDYTVPAKDNKTPFSFREYYKDNWTNFLGLKKTKKQVKNYSPWL